MLDEIESALCSAIFGIHAISRIDGRPTGSDEYVGFENDIDGLGQAVIGAVRGSGWPQRSPATKP